MSSGVATPVTPAADEEREVPVNVEPTADDKMDTLADTVVGLLGLAGMANPKSPPAKAKLKRSVRLALKMSLAE